jgi:hypothetical protein
MPARAPSPARSRRPAALPAALTALLTLALAGCAAAPSTDAAAGTGGASPTTDRGAGCTVDLLVQFSPQTPRPNSPAFLQELVQGSGYHLRYVRTLGTTLLLRLTGPDSTCDDGIALLRRHPAVKSLDVDERQFRHAVRPPEAR